MGILKIEVRSDRDHFNSLKGYSSIPVQSQMAYSSILSTALPDSRTKDELHQIDPSNLLFFYTHLMRDPDALPSGKTLARLNLGSNFSRGLVDYLW